MASWAIYLGLPWLLWLVRVNLRYIYSSFLAIFIQQRLFQIIAISLETAIQNGGISIIVLNMTFPSPYSDMGLLPVMSFFFCSTGPIMFVIYAVYLLGKKIKDCAEFKQVANDDPEISNS